MAGAQQAWWLHLAMCCLHVELRLAHEGVVSQPIGHLVEGAVDLANAVRVTAAQAASYITTEVL
ncbi:hypothetical protein DVH05_005335 [Phytophthora capsici]|nr:hypothetical protein DVH05_005335 [Phytophthora capsici]